MERDLNILRKKSFFFFPFCDVQRQTGLTYIFHSAPTHKKDFTGGAVADKLAANMLTRADPWRARFGTRSGIRSILLEEEWRRGRAAHLMWGLVQPVAAPLIFNRALRVDCVHARLSANSMRTGTSRPTTERPENSPKFSHPGEGRNARQSAVSSPLVFSVKDVNHFPGVFLILNPVSRLRAIKF